MEADSRTVVTGALVAGLLAGYGIALPVGAIGSYLVALTARTSLRVGCAAALGVASADGLYALAAVVGGGAVAGLLAPVAAQFRIASAVVLLGLATWTAVTAVRAYREQGTVRAPATPGAWRAYAGLLGLTLLNPATIVYFTALVVGNSHSVAASPPARMVFVVAAFTASASWQLALAGGGALLGRLLTGPRGRLLTGLASGVLIGALAIWMVW
ncbi:Arginine exporter protein ArgO [Amycolatopsis marina]|uniref:Arginine exporter protein ArgO n=1 Tax=Amycolatopsis marina TaxID=490629 RepID=A0A1I1C6L9_9PSEU|nr:LysE family transporter [Amycolatopsis marina]SFB58279.1 Arginine exporter protein ArgO [Amycolatopsis marina]